MTRRIDRLTILISRQLATSEGLAVGTVVRLATDAAGTGAREFRVAGIYEPTPDPSRLGAVPREVRLHLPDLLDLTRSPGTPAGTEYIAGINVALTDPADARAFARDVNARMPGVVARPSSEAAGSAGPFRVLERFHLAIAVVTIVASTVFLLALTIMLVDERRETVGILRLIGLPVRRVLVQVLLEGLIVAGAGAAFGLVLAVLSEGLINRLLPVALRHGARLRAHHSRRGAHLHRDCRSARRLGHRRRVVGAAAAQRTEAGPTMNAVGFAWRSLVRQPARATLGMLGVAAVGALLFDMLLLSQGLVVSMRDLLERSGWDIRVTAGELPGRGLRLGNAVSTAERIAALPSVRAALIVRLADARIEPGDGHTDRRGFSRRQRVFECGSADHAAMDDHPRPRGERRPAKWSSTARSHLRPICRSAARSRCAPPAWAIAKRCRPRSCTSSGSRSSRSPGRARTPWAARSRR